MSKVRRSFFKNQPKNTCTMKAGYWYPIFVKPTMPGDNFEVRVDDVIRTLPMLAPNYADVSVRLAAFHCDNRLLMDNYYDFRTGGKNNDNTDLPPYMFHSHAKNDVGFGTLTDFLNTAPALTFYDENPTTGVLTANDKVVRVPCWAERMYAKIGQDWLMNQNLEDESDYPLSTANGNNGEDTITNRNLFKCHWNHDYFTNMLPSQQKGPEVILPVGSRAPVLGGEPLELYQSVSGAPFNLYTKAGLDTTSSPGHNIQNLIAYQQSDASPALDGSGHTVRIKPDSLFVDLAAATGVPISMLNTAIAAKKIAVKLMLHGSRSVEWLWSMFGVKSSDQRLDRSRFLGSYSTDILISPVMQTSATQAGTTEQGNMSGNGFHSSIGKTFKCYSEEDGWFMILCSIRPRTQYCQGLPAYYDWWSRNDYPLPALAHLDFVAAKNKQIYLQGVSGGNENTNWDDPDLPDNQTFGFHPIFQELRTSPSEIHGQFLSTLRYWHMARIFANLPKLNKEFIDCTPPTRQFADPDSDHYLADFSIHFRYRRKLPRFGYPRYF